MRFSTATIRDNLIEDNQTSGSGWGIWIESGPVHLRGNTIRNNTAFSGGGIFTVGNHGSIADCVIVDNTGTNKAGGVWIDGNVRLDGNVVAGNQTNTFGGGGVLVKGPGQTVIINNLILYNQSFGQHGLGGGCLLDQVFVPILVANNTFVGNSANKGGAIALTADSQVELRNNILWSNTAGSGPAGHLGGEPCALTISHSVVDGGLTAFVLRDQPPGTLNYEASNLTDAPLFIDPIGPDGNAATWGDNNYHLQFVSPCIDAGGNQWSPSDDFDGDARPADGDQDGIATVDIGADELFCQLTHVGTATPGATITLVVTGPPGSDAYVYGSLGEETPAVPTPWGSLKVELPIVLLLPIGAIPSSGVATVPLEIPPTAIVGEPLYYLQAFVGQKLTNLDVVIVE